MKGLRAPNILLEFFFFLKTFPVPEPLLFPSPLSRMPFFQILFLFFNFDWRLITLQYCSGFSHTLTRISHGCTCVPHPDPPSHLPPHPIPLGLPSAPALSTLPVSHVIIYIFQCYSLRSSHPRLLPQSPKVCTVKETQMYKAMVFSVIICGFESWIIKKAEH